MEEEEEQSFWRRKEVSGVEGGHLQPPRGSA